MIKIDNSNIVGVSLGNTQFSKIYNGDDLVWNKKVITFINLDCNGEWQENTYSGTTINGYSVYESIYNHNVNNGKAKMIIYIDGNLTNKLSFKYRSDAQGIYDYLVISKLDTEIPNDVTYSNAYNNESIQYYTRGKQNTWYDAQFEITDNNKHFVEVLYLKNVSTNTEPDKGFVAFKNNEIIGTENIYDIILYQLKIKGKFTDDSTNEYWYINNGNASKKVDISEFVDPETKEFDVVLDNISPSNLFYNNDKIERIDSIFVPINKVSLSQMFYNCSSLNYVNLEDLKTNNVTSMNIMFNGCSSLKSLDLSHLDTHNVTTMSWLFRNCSNLETLNIDNLDTQNVTNMNYMFGGCRMVETLNLSNFDTRNVENMNQIFMNCSNLETLILGNWDLLNVGSLSQSFWECEKLKNVIGSIRNIKVDLVLYYSPLTNESAMVFINGLSSEIETTQTITFSIITYDTLTEEQIAIATSKGWSVVRS